MEVIVVALIVSVISPLMLAYITNKSRINEKREDWRRQDVVAARAAEVAERLLAKQEETTRQTKATAEQAKEAASLLVENNKVVADTAVVTNSKLDIIHTLVNSNMTAALQGELDRSKGEIDSAKGQVVLMREVIGLRIEAGQEPDPDAMGVLAALEAKVKDLEHKSAELEANLKDRLQQTKVADAQIFIAKEKKMVEEP